jgi:hypothetical protein
VKAKTLNAGPEQLTPACNTMVQLEGHSWRAELPFGRLKQNTV